MKYIAACFSAGLLAFTALNGAENAANTTDAALFAGNGNTGERYYRLGELALENFDAAGAADFFRQSLNDLPEGSLRYQATDRLLASLLAAGKVDEAEKLLKDAGKNQKFSHSSIYKLMQSRMLLYSGKTPEAIKLLKDLTVKLDFRRAVTFPALELLSKALSESGDYAAARQTALDMAVIAGNNDLQKFKALEWLIFLALANNDLEQAKKAQKIMQEELPEDLQKNLANRMEKLVWLVDCRSGKSKDVEENFLKSAEKSAAPDPLLARIAYALAENAGKDAEKAVKYAKLAYKFAEGAFRQTALKTVIKMEIAGKFWQDALNDALNFKAIFPAAPGQDELQGVIGDLYILLGRNDEAVKILSDLCKNKNADMQERCAAAGKLARLYQKQSKVLEASEMFKFAIENVKDKALKSSLEHEFGEYLYRLGRYNDAASYFRSAAAAGEKTFQHSQLYLAQSLYMLKSYEQAQRELSEIKTPADKKLLSQIDYLDALITEQLGKTDEAVSKFAVFAQKHATAPEASEALFHAGTLALNSKKFNGVELLQNYAERYPGEKAANALYKVLSADLLAGREAEAQTILNKLTEKYPESKFTIAGNFRIVDFLRDKLRYSEALAVLDAISKRYSSVRPELIPEILYDRAVIYGHLNDHTNKLAALEELVKKYADHPMAGRAFFMLGDLKASLLDAEAALTAFQQARKRSDGIFGYGCTGRTGDAAYTLYTKQRKEEYLLLAIESYESLLKNNDLPVGMRLQTLYKLGRALEDRANAAGALRNYRLVIYESLLCKRQGKYYQAIWSVKALDAALKMLLQAVREAPAADQAEQLKDGAKRLLKAAAGLDLPGEDINKQLELVEKTVPAASFTEVN